MSSPVKNEKLVTREKQRVKINFRNILKTKHEDFKLNVCPGVLVILRAVVFSVWAATSAEIGVAL